MNDNPEQRAIVEFQGRHALVLAGPGTGKTATTILRVEFLLNQSRPPRIGVVTFSRQAVQELRERMGGLKRHMECGQLIIGTFHGLSLQLLRKSQAAGEGVQLLKKGTQDAFLNNAAATSSVDTKTARQFYEKYSASWNAYLSAEEQEFVGQYMTLAAGAQGSDFSMLLKRCVAGFHDGTISTFPLDYLLIDEGQDADEVQHEWVLCHANAGAAVMIVGDDDQAIYGFRYSQGMGGLELFRRKTNAKVFRLQTNYRSKEEIVDAANALMSKGPDRYTKHIVSSRGCGGKVEAHQFLDLNSELDGMVRAVAACPHRWAVLARRNRDLDLCEEAIERRGIHYWRPKGESLLDSRPASVLSDLLRSLFERSPVRSLYTTLASLHILRSGDGIVDTSGLVAEDLFKRLVAATSDHLNRERAALVEGLRCRWPGWRRLAPSAPQDAIAVVSRWISPQLESREHEALEQFTDWLMRRKGSLAQRLDISKKKDEPHNCVVLLTLHASKGLQFDGCWNFRATDRMPKNSEVAEERRLFYVGLTRARDRHVVSCSGSETISRFINEAGISVIQHQPSSHSDIPSGGYSSIGRYSSLGRRLTLPPPPSDPLFAPVLTTYRPSKVEKVIKRRSESGERHSDQSGNLPQAAETLLNKPNREKKSGSEIHQKTAIVSTVSPYTGRIAGVPSRWQPVPGVSSETAGPDDTSSPNNVKSRRKRRRVRR